MSSYDADRFRPPAPLALVTFVNTEIWEITSFATEQNRILRSAKLQMRFERFRFNSSFLVDDMAIGIIGRNILNLVSIRLNGPSLTWHLD